MPESVRARSILLLTRADKLTSDEDREKVLSRVKREASDLFTHIHMASLLNLENTRDVLKDLVGLADSMELTDPTEPTVEVAESVSTPNVSDLLDEPQSKASVEIETPTPAQAKVSDSEMTDDMLIDSLDLSGEANLDDLGLGEDDDADMDEVLAALTGAAPAVTTLSKAPKTEAAPRASKAFEAAETEAPDASAAPLRTNSTTDAAPAAEGYASELWRTMSSTIPHDDQDAYEAAFDLFLEKIDAEIATLNGQLNMKAAG